MLFSFPSRHGPSTSRATGYQPRENIMRKRLIRKLATLFVLVAAFVALSINQPVGKAKAFSDCTDQCDAAYTSCMNCTHCPINYIQLCWNRYSACLDRCPVE